MPPDVEFPFSELYQLVSPLGNLAAVKMHTDAYAQCQGNADVVFESTFDVEPAILNLNGKEIIFEGQVFTMKANRSMLPKLFMDDIFEADNSINNQSIDKFNQP